MEPGLELLLRVTQDGFRGVNDRLDQLAHTQAQQGERIARLESRREPPAALTRGVDTKKFVVGLAGLTGIVLVLYEIGHAVFDLIAKIRG